MRIVNNSTSHVFYARTHDHSTMGVATGSTPVSTNFDVPVMETGPCQLYVVANGIPSAPSACNVGQPTGIYSPVNGTPLTSTSVTFSWGGTGSATAYWLDVGKEQGGNEYEQSGSQPTSTLSLTITLPSDGSAVWARLYSMISGTWQYSDYSYKALGGPASLGSINTPTPSTTLTKTSQAFTWSAGTGATAYELTAGSAPYGAQYYSSGNLGNVVTATAVNLPSNGTTVYVTLYSLVGGNWGSNEYTYTAESASAGIAAMTSPVGGTVLAGGTVTFAWSADANATNYGLNIGSTPGGNNYYNSGAIATRTTSESVKNLPVDGSPVYATLITVAGGTNYTNSYTYTAAGGNSALATLQSPTGGSALCSTSPTFTWNAPAQGTPYAYWVDIGTSPGTDNIYQSGSLPAATTSITVGGVALGGNPLYVTLYTEVSSTPVVWQHNSYNFIEASLDAVNSPMNSSVLGSPQQTFGWTNNNPSCTMTYELDISAIAPGGNDVWQSGDSLSGFSVTNPAGDPIPANSNIYTTLYTVNNGTVLGYTENAYTTSPGVKGSIVRINGGKR